MSLYGHYVGQRSRRNFILAFHRFVVVDVIVVVVVVVVDSTFTILTVT